MKQIKLTIIVPAYNEINTIQNLIDKICQINIDKIIILVDDCSTDGTDEVIFKNKDKINKIIVHKENKGKGAAIRSAQNYIDGEYVIIQDADLEYDPREYEKLLIPFLETDADIVYGSRFLGGGKYVRLHFFWHYLANKILTFFCNLVTNINMTDMETGFKAFKKYCLENLILEEDRFGFEPEFTIKMAKKKFKFYEVAISYKGRTYEQGKKIGLKDAFRALYCILKYTFK